MPMNTHERNPAGLNRSHHEEMCRTIRDHINSLVSRGGFGKSFPGFTIFCFNADFNAFLGVLGIKLLHGDNEEAELKDAVRIAAKAFSRLNTTGRVVPPVTSCNKTGHWESGDAVFK